MIRISKAADSLFNLALRPGLLLGVLILAGCGWRRYDSAGGIFAASHIKLHGSGSSYDRRSGLHGQRLGKLAIQQSVPCLS